MDIDTLNALVTSAIWRAEQLEEHGVGSARQAWAEVSLLEEELAHEIPLSEPEGRVARRGAVRAALKAGNYGRAQELTEHFTTEEDAPRALRTSLRKMLEEDTRALAGRFRYAAKHHEVSDAREVARRLQEGGAFGLAA